MVRRESENQQFPTDWKVLEEDVIIVHGIPHIPITKVLIFFSGKSVVTDICDGDIVKTIVKKQGQKEKGVEKL